jgi:2-isopropylmalate synthase
MRKGVELYDTTLRDGAQGEDISFTVEDKLRIAEKLEELGIHYIEAGWPGSNPKDDEFFQRARPKGKAKLVAFGSTRRKGIAAAKDKNLAALLKAETPAVTIFGKSWDFHVQEALHASLEENLEIIFDSVQFLKKNADEVIYDAEHFFDGYKANSDYALKSIRAAHEAGADRIVLCDTNGGTLPSEIFNIVSAVGRELSAPLGIHCHNDGELAVANSLAAVEAGATQIHGTINGIGERCGNANLVSIIPNLKLKLKIDCVSEEELKKLREVSRFVYELANQKPFSHQPYVGDSAFAHKGGVHVSAILKNRATYEHIEPEATGNRRRVLISDLAGQSSILYKAEEFGLNLSPKDPAAKKIVREVKELENKGYQFEGAEASLEILMRRALKRHRPFFRLIDFRVIDEKGAGEKSHAEATIDIAVDGKREHTAARGVGPVNALDHALRKALERFYPRIKEVELVDYKVRVLPAGKGTASQVRVLIESRDKTAQWGTVGVSENIIEASWQALVDSLEYKLMKDAKKGKRRV